MRMFGRSPMQPRTAIALAAFLLMSAFPAGDALAQAALSGTVSSVEEGAMEGVLVSPRKEASPVTITVVTDEHGRFSFPAERLAAGKYTLSIRAIGYRLDGVKAVDLGA